MTNTRNPRDEQTESAVTREDAWWLLAMKSLRPMQWSKNLFVLAPLVFGYKLGDPVAVVNGLVAFVSYCLLASAVYLLNDVIDIASDQRHPEKRLRPIARGAISRRAALFASAALTVSAMVLSAAVSEQFAMISLAYVGMCVCYCLGMKHVVVLDAMLIAVGFVLRVVGGAVAVDVVPSQWLVFCSFLLALFLAFSKRRQQLSSLRETAAQHRPVLGEYKDDFLAHTNSALVAATIVAYALYTISPETVTRFNTTDLSFGTLFVIFGLLRYMFLLSTSEEGQDPAKTFVTDVPLIVAVLLWVVYNAMIIYGVVRVTGHWRTHMQAIV